MSFRPTDTKREDFRKYLEKAGVLDTLTKVLVTLYEEQDKPSNALEFIKDKLRITPDTNNIDAMKQEIEELKQKVEHLSTENAKLKQRVEMETPPATPGE